jgi:hypothetical protein
VTNLILATLAAIAPFCAMWVYFNKREFWRVIVTYNPVEPTTEPIPKAYVTNRYLN